MTRTLFAILLSLIVLECSTGKYEWQDQHMDTSNVKYASKYFAIGNNVINKKWERVQEYGYSNKSYEEASNIALNKCNIALAKLKAHWSYDPYNSLSKDEKGCREDLEHKAAWNNIIQYRESLVNQQLANKEMRLLEQKKQQEARYENYISQCEYIGFKRGTDKMGECVLKIKETEIKIAQSNAQIASSRAQERSADSANTVNNVILLNEALKLMNPPRQNFNCQARPFGIYTNIYCN
jgi:hypothetical protein